MTHDNPFALDKLLAFAESKPADETYDSGNYCKCAFAQYIRHIGGDVNDANGYHVGGVHYNTRDISWTSALALPAEAYRIVVQNVNELDTFGALADRLRAALSKAATP